MPWFDHIIDLIADAEWCGRFREELQLDHSFLGWLKAFGNMVAGFAGRLAILAIGFGILAILLRSYFRPSP